MKTTMHCTILKKNKTKHKRTYLQSLGSKNCRDSADRLFRTWSSDGQREHQHARKVLLLQPARSTRICPSQFSHHPIVGSGLCRSPTVDFFVLICCSVHHLAYFRGATHITSQSEKQNVCVSHGGEAPSSANNPLYFKMTTVRTAGERERERLPGTNFQSKTPW